MKNVILILGIFFSIFTFSQNDQATTEDLFSLKVGAIGTWVNYEKSVSQKMTINGEVGYEGGFLKGTNDKIDYVFTTSLSIEPRYYYNLAKRNSKNKNIHNNAANYFSGEFYFIPDWLTSSNRNNVEAVKSFGIVPKYGIRRTLSKNILFEFAFGLGYAWYENNSNEIAYSLDLRVNFNF